MFFCHIVYHSLPIKFVPYKNLAVTFVTGVERKNEGK